MTSQLCTLLAGCILATIFGTSTARAASGRIAFSGAVVAPTCSVSDTRINLTASPQPGLGTSPHRFACGSADTVADAGRTYALTEVSLDTAAIGNDRVLAYFAGYLSATGVADAKLVTQTFE